MNNQVVTTSVKAVQRKRSQPTFYLEWWCRLREAWQITKRQFATVDYSGMTKGGN